MVPDILRGDGSMSELTAKELTALKDIKWNSLRHLFLVGNHEMASADLKFNSLNAL